MAVAGSYVIVLKKCQEDAMRLRKRQFTMVLDDQIFPQMVAHTMGNIIIPERVTSRNVMCASVWKAGNLDARKWDVVSRRGVPSSMHS